MSLFRRLLGLGPKPDLSLYRSPSTPLNGIPIEAHNLEVGMTIITATGTAKVVSVEENVLSIGDIKIGLEGGGGPPWFLRPGQVITIDDIVLSEIEHIRLCLAKAEAELAELRRSQHRSEKGDDRGH